jgi:hypothetical protein
MVLEDDAVLRPHDLAVTLHGIVNDRPDVCLLTHNPSCVRYDPTPLIRDEDSGLALHRVRYSQTSAAYVIRRDYALTLADHIGTAVADMEPGPSGTPGGRDAQQNGVRHIRPPNRPGRTAGHPRPTTAWMYTGHC